MFRKFLVCAVMLCAAAAARATVSVQKVAYKGWKDCYRISNGEVELIVTGDVGPRIIRYGFIGGPNLFKEFPDQMGKSGEPDFQMRGGDRVWKAPEDPIATWAPDNVPVDVQITPTGVIAREPVEPLTKLQKEIEVSLAPTGTAVTVSHRITNRGLFTIEFAPWALAQMADGGLAISEFPPRGPHPQFLKSTNPLTMWAYTDLTDPRWRFTRKYITLRQDPNAGGAQKLGLFNKDTWAAYLSHGELFVKRTTADPGAHYPDFGCSFETFTNSQFLEIETLGPVRKVEPGATAELVEHWGLFRNVKLDAITDADLDSTILPLVESVATQ